MRLAAGVTALVFALLVVAMSAAQLVEGPTAIAYAAIALVAPILVIAGDRLARDGSRRADAAAQIGVGIIAGMWALPATSGLVAIFAAVAGAWSAFHSRHGRTVAVLALVAGALIGVGVLALSLQR